MEILHERSKAEMVFYRGSWNSGLRPFHRHDRLEVLFPLDQPITVLLDGRRYEAAAGDVVVIGEQAVHAFEVEGDGVSFLLGQFPYSILLGCGVVPPPVRPFLTAAEIAESPALASQLEAIKTALLCEGENTRIARGEKSPLMQSLFSALYFLLARYFAAEAPAAGEEKERQEFHRIVAYVNEHFTEPMTVGSIASALYIDRGKLSRLFLSYSGQPLTSYITALRLARAAQLLREGTSVTVAALESGFQSVRTFHDVYRRTQNATPRSARKS